MNKPITVKQIIMQKTGADEYKVQETTAKIYPQHVAALSPAKYPGKVQDKNGENVMLNGCYVFAGSIAIMTDKTMEEMEKLLDSL